MATAQIPQIESQTRARVGTREAQRLRQAGQLPAVIYGHKQDPVHVSVDQAEITRLLHEHAHMLQVAVDGRTESCLIKDVQWDYLGSSIIHVDLARVDLTEQVSVDVELTLVGDPIGLKESGAYLDHPMTHIKVQCLASQIPESIPVNISPLEVGQSLTVADLSLPEGVTAVDDAEMLVVTVHRAAAVEEEAEDDADVAQPEVIRKRDKAGGDEDG